MGQLRWISVLATASAAASWLCTAGAWKLYRSHDLAVNGSFEAADSFLEAQWGQLYVDVPGTKNPDGSISFVFVQSVNGYVVGHEPPKTPEGSGSTENAVPNEESSNAGQGGSTGGSSPSEETSGTQSSGEVSTSPGDVGGSSGSTQGTTSSESVESAPSGGATGNGGASTSPENAGASANEVVFRDFVLGSCNVENMTGTGPSEFQTTPNIQTLQDCHKLCLDNDRCNWYTYNANTKRCYLKGERGPMRQGSAGDITSPKYCDSSCYRKNRQVVGTEISADLDPSAFFCHYRCHMDSRCHYWSWHRLSTQCRLFSDAGIEGVRPVQDIVSGPRGGCGSEAKAGEESHLPEHVVSAPTQEATGSTQGPTSSGTVETAPPTGEAGSTGGSASSGNAGASTGGASGSHQEAGSSGNAGTPAEEPGREEVTTSPEHAEGSSGSIQGPTSSESVESAPSGGATSNDGASTSPENAGSSASEVVLQDFELGSCRIDNMTGTGPSEFQATPNIQTLQDCHKLCLDDDRCNWYTYNANTKRCFLKGESGPIREGAAGDITSPKYCDSSCYRKNRQVVGTEISASPETSPFFCHYRCHMDSRCHYWSWHRLSTQCQLFSDAGVEGVRLVQDIVSGPRGGCGSEAKAGEVLGVPEHVVNAPTQGETGSTQGPSSPEQEESSTAGAAGNGVVSTLPEEENTVEEEEVVLEDVELGPCRFEEMSVTGPGEFLNRGGVQTLQACHDICLNDDRCTWYTYNVPNKRCYLKANAGPLRHVLAGDITSPKYCDPSCYIKNKKVLGTLLETLSGRLMTAFTCHYECHFRSDCYYWSWDSKTLDCHLFSSTGLQGKKVARGFVSGPRDGCGVEAKEGGISAIP